MGKNRYTQLPDDADEDIDVQIARLREILKLMAPENGSAALGALRRAAPDMPLSDRLKALGGHRT